MGTKENPAPYDCYANALPDEPMFILLARDLDAAAVVTYWAYLRWRRIGRGQAPESDKPMVKEACECANSMTRWRIENDGKWRPAS